jgi:hypothetical protein
MVNKLFIRSKAKTIIALVLLVSVLAAAYPYIASVRGQNQATVNVLDSVGGSTDPLPGTYTYNGGAQVTLTATPDEGLVFATWLISTDASNDSVADNPYSLTVTGGVTYNVSAVFAQLTAPIFPNPPIPTPDPAIYGSVSILHASGGRTQPAEGTYYFTSVYKLKLTAIAESGWRFSYWVISGDTNTGHGGYPFTLTPTDNPYTLDCGLGYSYAYQPVFVPVENSNPPPNTPPSEDTGGWPTEIILIAVAVVEAIVIIILAIAAYSYSKRQK